MGKLGIEFTNSLTKEKIKEIIERKFKEDGLNYKYISSELRLDKKDRDEWFVVVKCDKGHIYERRLYNFYRADRTSNTCFICSNTKQRKVTNNYIPIDDTTTMLYIENTQGKSFEVFVDNEDVEKIVSYSWYLSKTGYVFTNKSYNKKKYKIRLHRLLLGVELDKPVFVVDHIDNNPLNNRKGNLRLVTQWENILNSKHLKVRKIHRGVSLEKNKWRAKIHINNRRINLGLFDNYEDAVQRRLQGEIEYKGHMAFEADKICSN